MSITDELRESMSPCMSDEWLTITKSAFEAIADRIDAEHENATSRAGQLLADAESDRNCYYVNWQDCKQKVLQHNITIDELNARIECLEDELSHSIELPKDADGVLIRVGDVMKAEKIGGGFVEPFEVVGYIMSNGELEPMDKHKCPRKHKYLHHRHKPTVEDVLRELAEKIIDSQIQGVHPTYEESITEYAAKLRLTDDGEE